MYPRCLPFALAVPRRYDERCPGFDCELVHAANDTAHGVVRQRPDGGNAVPLVYFILRRKNRRTRQRPVDDLRGAAPWQQFSAAHFRTVSRGVCALRPDDRTPVAAGNQHQPTSGSRRTIVGCHQLAPFHAISQCPKLPDELLKRRSGQFLYRFPLTHRPPRLELFDVFKDDDAWAHLRRPAQDDPREAPDLAVNKRRALCL